LSGVFAPSPLLWLRLIDLHERSKLLQAEVASGHRDSEIFSAVVSQYEVEIAFRMVREAQREREQWARERHGWQPRPCA
jgi:tRNA(Phe) wybutosine-synthesizing methylase Tyw3